MLIEFSNPERVEPIHVWNHYTTSWWETLWRVHQIGAYISYRAFLETCCAVSIFHLRRTDTGSFNWMCLTDRMLRQSCTHVFCVFYFLYFSHIVIVFLCPPIIYHTGVTYSCGDIIITKRLWQLMKISPNMKRSVDILATLFTFTEVSSYGKFWLLDIFTFKSSFLTAKLSLCPLYSEQFRAFGRRV